MQPRGRRAQAPQNPGPSSAVAGNPIPNPAPADTEMETDVRSGRAPAARTSLPTRRQIHIPISFANITVIHGDPIKYQCKYCNKTFKTKGHIRYHDFCHVASDERSHLLPFRCGQCGQGFIAKSHYDYHCQVHTGLRPFKCMTCGNSYSQKNKLTRHILIHTNQKLFQCECCDRSFSSAQTLKMHSLLHTDERPFLCHICDKGFKSTGSLRKHMVSHSTVPDDKLFPCHLCEKKFVLKWSRDVHVKTHAQDKCHKCNKCPIGFMNKKDLRRHMVIHSGLRPYACLVCFTQFRRSDNLRRHIRGAHKLPESVVKSMLTTVSATALAAIQDGTNGMAEVAPMSSPEQPGPSTSAALGAVQQGQNQEMRNVDRDLNRTRRKALVILHKRKNDKAEAVLIHATATKEKSPASPKMARRTAPKKAQKKLAHKINASPNTRSPPSSTIVRPAEIDVILPERLPTPTLQVQVEENVDMGPGEAESEPSEQTNVTMGEPRFEMTPIPPMLIKEEPVDNFSSEFLADYEDPSTVPAAVEYNYTIKEEPGSADYTQVISVYSTPTEINYTVRMETEVPEFNEPHFENERDSVMNSVQRPVNRFLLSPSKSDIDVESYAGMPDNRSSDQFYRGLEVEWGMVPFPIDGLKAEPAELNEEIPDACCVVEV